MKEAGGRGADASMVSPPGCGVMAYTYPEHLADFVEAGVDVFRLSLPLGWVGPDTFDYTEGDALLERFVCAAPQARLFPLLWLNGVENKWWEREYPDELAVGWERKTDAPYVTHPDIPPRAIHHQVDTDIKDVFDRYHQQPPSLPSFASTVWRREVLEALRKAIIHYEDAFPGRMVGYYLCAGLSYEWFNYGNYTDDVLFDYSAPMRAYFQRWLAGHYGDVATCAAAWQRPVRAFDELNPPPPSQRPARDEAPLLDPAQYTPAADFARALSDAQADLFIDACRTARHASQEGARVGGFWGYWWTQTDYPGPARSGHLALQRVLESPDVDYLASPYDYTQRGVGGANTSQTSPGSVRRHGKGYINSVDIKLGADRYGWHSFIKVPQTEAEAVELMKRDFAYSLTEGQEQSWVDLFGGAFRHPGLRAALTRLQQCARERPALRSAPREECLVVVDEESLRWTTPNTPLTVPLFGVQKQWHLLTSGFPWTFITLADYLALDFPHARLVYFVNLFRCDPAQAQRVQARLRKTGATAVWTLWPGALGSAGWTLEGVHALTGFTVEQVPAMAGDWNSRFRAEAGAALEGQCFGTGIGREAYEARMKYYPPPAAFATAPRLVLSPANDVEYLADWTDGAGPCLGSCFQAGYRSVFNAGPLLPAPLLQQLAQTAGAHVYAPPHNVVYANDRVVAVYTGQAGPQTIHLRRPAMVEDLWASRWLHAAPVESFTIDGSAQTTHLLALQTDNGKAPLKRAL